MELEITTAEVVSPLKKRDDDSKSSKPVDMERHQKTKGGRTHSEEDGKHHHIHFHRLTQSGRRRLIILFLAKLILIVSHISVLIYVFAHSIH